MLTSSKITRRWFRNSFSLIAVIVLIICVISSTAIRRSYYNQAEQMLESEANIITNTLQQYSKSGTGNFEEKVRDLVTNFDKREVMELMIINADGQTEITSSGFIPEEKAMPDYINATENTSSRTGTALGRLSSSREKSMLFSVVIPVNNEASISAVRIATSMTQVDRQIFSIILGITLLGITMLALVLFSSYYFIRGIVRPIGQVGETARKIAQGDFGARLDMKYDDEIGELAGIINYMAGELDTAEKLKNDFISSVSHELRTPLTAIQGWGETVRSDRGKDTELLDKGMNVIIGETHRLSGMVEELLDFSRMQSGRLKLVKSPMDPVKELREAVFMYTQKARRENIELTYNAPEKETIVYADKNRLRQVFINIIDNAIKYSDPEDKVCVDCSITEENFVVRVEDTGIGISKEDLPQITKKFYKADSTRRGSGIGLAVAEEIVNRHGGTLLVDSVQGEGTTITMTLPVYKGQRDNIVVEDDITLKQKESGSI